MYPHINGLKVKEETLWFSGHLRDLEDNKAKACYFKSDILVLFMHNSYGTSEFPDCGNLVGEDCMENLRWANTEPSVHLRKTNTDPSMHFRKANTDISFLVIFHC